MINFNIESHKPLRELVYDELKMAILSGELKAGTRLMEVDLAKEMGVSRTPVREALRKLERDKLLKIEPRKGVYVSDVSVKDMLDVLQIREILESLAAYLAAENMQDDEKVRLLHAKTEYERAMAEDNKPLMMDTDTLFHKIIVESSGNSYLISICNDIREIVQRFRSKYFNEFDRAETVRVEHDEIYVAICENSQERAKAAAAGHTMSLREALNSYAEKLRVIEA